MNVRSDIGKTDSLVPGELEFPKISEPLTATQLCQRVLMQLALMAAGNGKPSKNGTPKEGRR